MNWITAEAIKRALKRPKGARTESVDKTEALNFAINDQYWGLIIDQFGPDLKDRAERLYCKLNPKFAGDDGLLDSRWYGTEVELYIDQHVMNQLNRIVKLPRWRLDKDEIGPALTDPSFIGPVQLSMF